MLQSKYARSIAFPDMFGSNGWKTYNGWNSLKSDLKLLLQSEKGTFYGDPNYGVSIKKIIYSQAAEEIVLDLIKDDIFEAIMSYFPNRLTISRDDIDVSIHQITDIPTGGGNGICQVQVSINLSGTPSGEQDNFKISLMIDNDQT